MSAASAAQLMIAGVPGPAGGDHGRSAAARALLLIRRTVVARRAGVRR